ncbi:MAG: hypothetical protein CMM58_04100 [Rhodospirillaceae bacterium]|nr:hypothetical protein [Rhodospirillaceae bacterium]|tara:strand:+ start:3054 stop:5192 length:2139 start_codon:yes stop_codon:yes gene_type:complete
MTLKKLCLILTCLLLPIPWSSEALDYSGWKRTEMADFRLISGVSAIGNDRKIPVGLQFKLRDGWKIYWRHPGDAGFPPSLSIQSSSNLEKMDWAWPLPERFVLNSIQSFGYRKEVIFPITLTVAQSKKPLSIISKLNALVCKDICVPIEDTVSLKIPSGIPSATKYTDIIDHYKSLVPTAETWKNFKIIDIAYDLARLQLTIETKDKFSNPDVFIESSGNLHFGKPTVTLFRNGYRARLDIPLTSPKNIPLKNQPVTMTFLDNGRFKEIRRVISITSNKPPPSLESSPKQIPWLSILGIAFLGGVILNFMPCVLPVLAIKLLAVSRASGVERNSARVGFFYSGLGVLATFSLLAIFAISLKAVGVFVTWGMQFQEPIFITLSSIVILFFAANLWGWVYLQVPDTFINPLSRRFSSRLPANTKKPGLNEFMTGFFVTVLATPCSAPFVGTALTFALGRGAAEIICIFLIMGAGLASPYFFIALYPNALKVLPKPGPWMRKLEIVLGGLLILTAAWLMLVLLEQLSLGQASIVSLFIIGGFIALGCTHFGKKTFFRTIAVIFAFFAVLFSGAPKYLLNHPLEPNKEFAINNAPIDGRWLNFEPVLIRQLVARGNTVFVDVTADWCLNCKLNDALFLSRGIISKSLSTKRIIGFRADWTAPNKQIASYLQSFGRHGIPFNVVYGPSAPQGIPLPELLSENSIRKALLAANYNRFP